jgi:hypothetical protein
MGEIIPISQAPGRNFMLCREIRKTLCLVRLVRRPAELPGFHGVMAKFRTSDYSVAQRKSRNGKEMQRNGFFSVGTGVCAPRGRLKDAVNWRISAGTPRSGTVAWGVLPPWHRHGFFLSSQFLRIEGHEHSVRSSESGHRVRSGDGIGQGIGRTRVCRGRGGRWFVRDNFGEGRRGGY